MHSLAPRFVFASSLAGLAGAFILAGCGDSTPPPNAPAPALATPATSGTTPTATDAPAATPLPSGFTLSQEGGDCGDEPTVQKKCGTGLYCAAGKCTKAKP